MGKSGLPKRGAARKGGPPPKPTTKKLDRWKIQSLHKRLHPHFRKLCCKIGHVHTYIFSTATICHAMPGRSQNRSQRGITFFKAVTMK
jgi:hypothetical protein